MPLSTSELLAKAFNESPAQSSRIVLNIKKKANTSDASDSNKKDASWIDLAKELEESGMNFN